MKITKQQLQQIIKEELQTEMDASQEGRDERFEDVMTQASYEEILEIVEVLLMDVTALHLSRAPDPTEFDRIERKLQRIMDLLTKGY